MNNFNSMLLSKRLKLAAIASLFCIFFVFSQSKKIEKESNGKLLQVLEYFQKKGSKEQYDAAVFLVKNIPIHYSEDNAWLDKNGKTVPFKVTDYKDIEQAEAAFIELKNMAGMVSKSITIRDSDAVDPQVLIKNIEMAFESWKENPWSKSYDFKTFCEYILPYRSLTEPLQDWRSDYQLTFEKLSAGMADPSEPGELCYNIMNNIKHFDFELKRFDPKPLLGPNDLLFWREGNCPDLANAALFACRSLGVAATFDCTPHYAASSNRHYWNTVIDNKGRHIPFNGNQDLPYVYNAVNKRLGKVFRFAFSEQKNNLPSIIAANEIPEDLLKSRNIIDVTSEYVDVSDISYAFSPKAASKVSYISVFNRGNWRVLDWARITDKVSVYKNMGRDIVYLPGVFAAGKMAFEEYPVLLDKKGASIILKPDALHSFSAKLSRENEHKNSYTDNNPLQIVKGEKYRIYVWSGNWRMVDEQAAIDDNNLVFSKLPKNGLFLMCPSKPDFYERIFTVNPETSLITWY